MIYALIGNLSYAAAQFGVLVLFARQTTPEEVGQYALALALTAPLHLGLGLRLRTVRAVSAITDVGLRQYFSLGLTGAALALTASSIAGVIIYGPTRGALIVFAVSISKWVEALIDISYGELQRRGDLRGVASSQIVRGVATLTAVFVTLQFTGSLLASLAVMASAWLLQFALLEYPRAMRDGLGLRVRKSSKAVPSRQLLLHALPLGLTAAITSLNAAVPRYVVSLTLGDAALGIYAVLAYSTVAMNLLANSAGQGIIGQLASWARSGQVAKVWAAGGVLAITVLGAGVALVALLMVAGEPILSTVFGSEYGEQYTVAVLLAGSATIGGLATIAYYILTSSGNYRSHPIISVTVAIVTVPTVGAFAINDGLTGVAQAMILVHIFQLSVTLGMAWRRLRRQPGT